MRERTPQLSYATFEDRIIQGRRIFFSRDVREWFERHGYEGPGRRADSFLHHMRLSRGWNTTRFGNIGWVHTAPWVSDAELAEFCLANGIREIDGKSVRVFAEKAGVKRPLVKTTAPASAPEVWPVRECFGWSDMQDYVRRAADTLGVVPSRVWYGSSQLAGARR